MSSRPTSDFALPVERLWRVAAVEYGHELDIWMASTEHQRDRSVAALRALYPTAPIIAPEVCVSCRHAQGTLCEDWYEGAPAMLCAECTRQLDDSAEFNLDHAPEDSWGLAPDMPVAPRVEPVFDVNDLEGALELARAIEGDDGWRLPAVRPLPDQVDFIALTCGD